ncbi:MAG: sugar-transfer associated ATP-grasp domain-containing protein [Pseudomonadota bacterium]|nr:sugar-transfer associated ATP-grasp domain-containing protein [Pseudomonadota bacterium]
MRTLEEIAVSETRISLDYKADMARVAALQRPPKVDNMRNLRAAAQAGLRGFQLFRDQTRLNFGKGGLTPDEYYYYRLYDKQYSFENKRQFAGLRAQRRFHYRCNDVAWHAMTNDKMNFYSFMQAQGFAVPKLHAVYCEQIRSFSVPTYRSIKALRDYLVKDCPTPCFMKPVEGMYSIGAFDIASIDDKDVHLRTGDIIAMDEFLDYIHQYAASGYVVQERLEPHKTLAKNFGPTLGCVRALVLLSDEARVASAVFKVPSGKNVADNYWRTGNMLGALDADTGAFLRVVSGTGADLQEHDKHPVTGAAFSGMKLPDWREVLKLMSEAPRYFSGVKTQSWDIALTTRGPIALEVNWGGDLNLHQISHGKGILQGEFLEHLKKAGVKI